MKSENELLGKIAYLSGSLPWDVLKVLLMVTSIVPTLVFAATSGPSPIPPPPAFQISTNTLTLCRGVENNVPILVTNPGSQPMTSLQVGVVSSRNIYAIGNGTVNEATVPANGSTTVYLPLFVSLNTSNLVSVGVTVNYNFYTLYSDSEVRNVSFSVETCPAPLLIETNPVITSGQIENVTLNLTNVADTALSDIALQMSIPSSDAAILTSQPVHVGTLLPGQSTTVNVRTFVFSDASQTFPLNVSVQLYNGTSPVQILNTFPTLSTGTINLTASSVTFSPTNPIAGSIFSISMILTDTGTASASAVAVTPIPPRGISVYGSNSVFVGDMSVDTQVPVTLTLVANASLKGTYEVPLVVSYINGIRQTINTTIEVPVTFSAALPANAFNTGSSGVYVTGNGSTYTLHRSGSGFVEIVAGIIIIVAVVVLYLKRKRVAELVGRMKKRHAGGK